MPDLVSFLASIGASIGLGGLLGAGLTYYFGLRKERWNFKRDLYARLLENLGEVDYALGELLEIETRFDNCDNEEFNNRLKVRAEAMKAREIDGVEKIRRATSIARMMINDKSLRALEDLQSEWAKAERADSYFEHVDMRGGATAKAYKLLVETAKCDLKL